MKVFSNILTVLLASVILSLAATIAFAQTAPAAVQYLPVGEYSVDSVPVLGNGRPTFGNVLVITGNPKDNWKESSYRFFGNSNNPCTINPGIVTQKISENNLVVLISRQHMNGCTDIEWLFQETGDVYIFQSWEAKDGIRLRKLGEGKMKKK